MTQITRSHRDLDDIETIAARVLEEAKRCGASAAEAGVSVDTGLSVSARLGEVETLEHHNDQGLGVTVYFGQRKGAASTSDLSEQALTEAVAKACTIARYTAEDSCAGLAEAGLMASEIPDLELDHPWALTAEHGIDLAIECENAARESDARITNSEGASVSSLRSTAVYSNSHGFIGGYAGTRHSLGCAVIGAHNGHMQRDYWYTAARQRDGLQAATAIGRKAAERTVRRLGGRSLATRRAPIVFEAPVARSLLGHLVGAVSGGALYRKASFLLDKVGEQIFPGFVRIHEQPLLKTALGSAPFDNEGVATHARDLVTDGVLQGYVLSSYSARRLGLETTGNAGGVHNLSVDPGAYDLAGLLAQMDSGLLVTELIGQGVNTVTGDYSRGASGFWVEHGEIQYPVEEITIAGNLKDMFMGLREVGNDVDARGNVRSGSLLIEQMTIAGE